MENFTVTVEKVRRNDESRPRRGRNGEEATGTVQQDERFVWQRKRYPLFSGKTRVDDEPGVAGSQARIGRASNDRKENSPDGKKQHDQLELITSEPGVEAATALGVSFAGNGARSAFLFHGVLSRKWVLALSCAIELVCFATGEHDVFGFSLKERRAIQG